MSNYSVKLTKCGKCQLSLAHLPSGGGLRVADLWAGLQVPSRPGPRGRGPGAGKGQCPLGGMAGRPWAGWRGPRDTLLGGGDALAGTEAGKGACSPTRWSGC